MPKTPNGKKPPPPAELHFERSPVQCRRCKRKFENYVIEEIDELTQLRCGDTLITRAEIVCMHCGWVFSWTVDRNKLERMAVAYEQLIVEIQKYNPE